MAGIPLSVRATVDTRGFDGIVSQAKTRTVEVRALRKGIRVTLPMAKAGAPKATGTLKRAQNIKAGKSRRNKFGAWAVQGARKSVTKTVGQVTHKPSKYDHLVMGGTRPHRLGKGEKLAITRTRGKTGQQYVVPGTAQTTGRQHPGTKPNPYRRRAWQANKERVGAVILEEMNREMQKTIAKESAKLAKV